MKNWIILKTLFSGKLKGPIIKFNKWANSENPLLDKSG